MSEVSHHKRKRHAKTAKSRDGVNKRALKQLHKTVTIVTIINKLKKRKDGGTPEKSQTPNPDEASEDSGPAQTKNVITGADVLSLAIKEDDLLKLREPHPPETKKTPVTQPVVVRKRKPQSELDKPTPRVVTVARPAPPNAPIKPVDTSVTGPRFDAMGNVIPHSILGTLEDFKKEAERRGESVSFEIPERLKVHTPTVKYEKKKKASSHPRYQSVDETNALVNWQKKMLERKKQQGYISKLLQKSEDTLLMNHGDNYRKKQEERYLIDRTIPSMDYGKGYRVGSEFWKQQERIGDDLEGMHMTLTQTERGYPPPIEHVGVPTMIKEEKGVYWSKPSTPVHYPWDRSAFLKQRKQQLQTVMDELDPHKPDMSSLAITGFKQGPKLVDKEDEREEPRTMSEFEDSVLEDQENLDPLKDHPDVVPEPIFGPSILFAGRPARWTGDSYSFQGQQAFEARVTFEGYSGQRKTSFLEVVNNGTTSIYYDWKKLPKSNPFDIVNSRVQRFYFNTSGGVILPGDTMKFPFVFKSPNAGVFTEQWQFETRPVVCGGASLVVTLRGVALQEDKFKHQRSEIEKELAHKQAEQIIRQIVDDVVEGVQTPDRARSPVDAYITREDIFERKNQGMHFSNETVTELNELYKNLFPEEERDDVEWDLSLETLREAIMEMDEDDEQKQEFLQQLNSAVISLSFPPFSPIQQEMYKVAYQALLETIDSIVGQSMMIRQVLGLPEKEFEEFPEGDITHSTPHTSHSERPGASQKAGRGQDSKKDSKAGQKGGKDAKTPKGKEKDSGKDKDRGGGKLTASPKKPPSRQAPTPSSQKDMVGDRAATATPHTGNSAFTPAPDVDPVLDRKYKEKLSVQTYNLLREMVDRSTYMFEDIRRNEDVLALAKLGLQG
ncbi:MYCBP-associated protein-like isoform X2 [Lingula anatina]|uniref:MYCBP-associated protein-like isoform X2 n=1 Tax=Lingula anatina TaxID=7574 RepID=A0A2R2MRE5_LINAN|nr:MYCBP-associated protein-like isoform X2 [Lingula anatina]|eukprot:XP_023932821.1 MYCBP-associated protein-like isoform X2 [Lingula anatina]